MALHIVRDKNNRRFLRVQSGSGGLFPSLFTTEAEAQKFIIEQEVKVRQFDERKEAREKNARIKKRKEREKKKVQREQANA